MKTQHSKILLLGLEQTWFFSLRRNMKRTKSKMLRSVRRADKEKQKITLLHWSPIWGKNHIFLVRPLKASSNFVLVSSISQLGDAWPTFSNVKPIFFLSHKSWKFLVWRQKFVFAILWRCHSLVFVQLLLHIPFLFLDPSLTVLVQANLRLVHVQAGLQLRQLRAWSAAGAPGRWIDRQSLKRNNQNTWKERVVANTENVFFFINTKVQSRHIGTWRLVSGSVCDC